MYFHTFQNHCIPQTEIEQVIQGRVIPVGYVNATAMCQSVGKKPKDYLRNKDSQARMTYVSSVTHISLTDLVFIIQGGDPTEQGTWVHPKIARSMAQWCSTEMWYWADEVLGHVLSEDFDPNSASFQEARHQAQQVWNTLRSASKDAFYLIGDEIKAYLLTDRATENDQLWLYSNCQNAINKGLFGKTAIEIKEELGIGKNKLNRDHYNTEALKRLERVQFTASKFIAQGQKPLQAIESVLRLYDHELIDYQN